jgi:hypothetical protein
MQGVAAKNDASYDLSRARARLRGTEVVDLVEAEAAARDDRFTCALRTSQGNGLPTPS